MNVKDTKPGKARPDQVLPRMLNGRPTSMKEIEALETSCVLCGAPKEVIAFLMPGGEKRPDLFMHFGACLQCISAPDAGERVREIAIRGELPCAFCRTPTRSRQIAGADEGDDGWPMAVCEGCATCTEWVLLCRHCGSTFPMPETFDPDLICPFCKRQPS